MPSTLTPLIPQILLRLLVASVVGAGSYLTWRSFQIKWPIVTNILSGLSSAVVFIPFITSVSFMFAIICLIIAIPICFLGGVFHRRSIDSSETQVSDIFIILSASFSSLIIGAIADFTILNIRQAMVATLYYVDLAIFPAGTPFLFWAWHNMKLRPGIDKHLNE